MLRTPAGIEIEDETDPAEIARAQEQRAQFDRNSEWLQANLARIYREHRGKFICIAGQEVFAAENVHEAVALAMTAHPDDRGSFTRYLPQHKMVRLYAS